MVKEDIETVIDRLYDYINANKQTSVKDAATILALPEEQVEKLSFLLEESNLIEVRYSLTGATLVSKEKAEPKHISKEEAKESFEGKAGLLEEQVVSAESIAEFMEKDLMRRLKDAEANLKALESQKTISQYDVKKLHGEMNYLSEKMAAFEQAVKRVEERGGGLSSEIDLYKKRLKVLEKTKAEKPVQQKLMEFLVFYILFLKTMLQKIVASKKTAKAEAIPPKPQAAVEKIKAEKKPAEEKKKTAKQPAMQTVKVAELTLPKMPVFKPFVFKPPSLPKLELPKLHIPKVEVEFLPDGKVGKEIEEIKSVIQQTAGTSEKPKARLKTAVRKPKAGGKQAKRQARGWSLPKFKVPRIRLSKPSQKKYRQTPISALKGMVRTARGFKRVMEKRKDTVRQHYWKKRGKKK